MVGPDRDRATVAKCKDHRAAAENHGVGVPTGQDTALVWAAGRAQVRDRAPVHLVGRVPVRLVDKALGHLADTPNHWPDRASGPEDKE